MGGHRSLCEQQMKHRLLIVCLLILWAKPVLAESPPPREYSNPEDYAVLEGYSNLEAHTYEQAPVYLNGQWHRTKGVYYTGVQMVRLANDNCGAQISRFLGMQPLFGMPEDPEEAAAMNIEEMLLLPEIGTVFIPLPCEDVQNINLKALEKRL